MDVEYVYNVDIVNVIKGRNIFIKFTNKMCIRDRSIINVSKFLQTNNLLDVVINFKALIIFLVIFFLTKKFDKHPIVFIGIGALAGIVFKL